MPTSPTGGGRSVGTVRSRTKATEFFFFKVRLHICKIYSTKHTVGMYHRQCIMHPVTATAVTNLLH